MMRCAVFVLFLPLGLCSAAQAAGLNDTGIQYCGGASAENYSPCRGNEPAGQDAAAGRDAAAAAGHLGKAGGGRAGFDFSKIAQDGAELPAAASLGSGPHQWACTRDNVSGLLWEVKTRDKGLRDQGWTYSWYDSRRLPAAEAGAATAGLCQPLGQCDSEKYVAGVNAAGLCGYRDWRLPTVKELESLVDFSLLNPALDPDWFPNTPAEAYWSATPAAASEVYGAPTAWSVSFKNGAAGYGLKNAPLYLRLVRGGQ